jgi:hypothetical protein
MDEPQQGVIVVGQWKPIAQFLEERRAVESGASEVAPAEPESSEGAVNEPELSDS